MSRLVLVTGAAGFIGPSVARLLAERGWRVRGAVRRASDGGRLPPGVDAVVTGAGEDSWPRAAAGCSAVVHLAARAHRMRESGPEAQEAYRRDNAELTRVVAASALEAGVRRLVFLSSVKAMGEETPPDAPWTEESPCAPRDAYGRSKLEAEEALGALAREGGLDPVILRVPLVYGPGVKANMGLLLKAVAAGIPLPLASIRNRRSFLFVGNLADAVAASLEHPAAAGQTFLVSDGEDMSTPELARRLARALDRPARLWPCPESLLRLGGALAGRGPAVRRLLDSLAVDGSKIRSRLGWKPPYGVDSGLRAMAGRPA